MVRGTDGLAQIVPTSSGPGGDSLGVWAWLAYGTASATSAQTTAPIASVRRGGRLRIVILQLGMKRAQRRTHELRDLSLCPDAAGVERARDL